MKLRDYQQRTVDAVERHWANGTRSVLVVAPTGAGKTEMGVALARGKRTLWTAHRQELVRQAARRLRAIYGADNVGVIMPGEPPNPGARIQVASTQTLLERGANCGEFDLVGLDEAHHYEADTYRDIRRAHPNALCAGFTATPEREDGRGLGDTFEVLVQAATYRELIDADHLIAPEIIRPMVDLGSDLSADPIAAWLAFAGGRRTFAFYPRVAIAEASLHAWRMAGVRADHLDGETPKSVRKETVEAFDLGMVDVMTNVFVLTEGIDVPNAEVVLSARKFEFVGAMIQAMGRVMRPAPGKTRATILDLCGSTVRHGMPYDEREYSLHGTPIKLKEPKGGTGGGAREFNPQVVGVPLECVRRGEEAVPAIPDAGRELPKPLAVKLSGKRLKKIREKHGARAARLAEAYWEGASK